MDYNQHKKLNDGDLVRLKNNFKAIKARDGLYIEQFLNSCLNHDNIKPRVLYKVLRADDRVLKIQGGQWYHRRELFQKVVPRKSTSINPKGTINEPRNS